MPVRYYPSFKVKPNQITKGNAFLLNGIPYVGLYYTTSEGASFAGANPIVGSNEFLEPMPLNVKSIVGLSTINATQELKQQLANTTKGILSTSKYPTPYFPRPIQSDYDLGYIDRYFMKKENENGYIMEISPSDYLDITNGRALYSTSLLQVIKIRWKLTGSLNTKRISQYDIRAGIIDTNQRLVTAANPGFFGIIDYIGGEYSKFAHPTE
jgi:hypothetical protein